MLSNFKFAFALFFLTVVSVCVAGSELNKAHQLIQKADYEAAYMLLSDLLKKEHTNEEKAEIYDQLGICQWQLGNNELAGNYLKQALNLYEKLDNQAKMASVYNDLGLIKSAYSSKEAIFYYEKALAIYRTDLKLYEESYFITSNNLGIIYRQTKKPIDALRIFEEVLAKWIAQHGDTHPNVAFTYSNIGQAYADLSLPDSALTLQNRALSIYETNFGKYHPEIASTYNLIAALYEDKEEYDVALRYVQKAVVSNTKNDVYTSTATSIKVDEFSFNPILLIRTLQLKARILTSKFSNKTLAPRYVKASLDVLLNAEELIQQQRRQLSSKADKIELGALAAEIFEEIIGHALFLKDEYIFDRAHYENIAFDHIEKNKGAVLLESISDMNAKSFAMIDPALLAQEKELTESISGLKLALSDRFVENEGELRTQLITKTQELEKLIGDLESKYPEYYALKYQVKQASIEDIRKKLNDDMLFVSFFVGEKSIYSLHLSKTSIKFFEKSLDEQFDKNISGLRNSLYLKAQRVFRSTSQDLFATLFPKGVSKKYKQLIIIPDGRTSVIPFETLLQSKKDTASYLLRDYVISYHLSGTLYTQTKAQSQQGGISLFAPVSFGAKRLSTLNGTKTEVEQISALFKGDDQNCAMHLFDSASTQNLKSPLTAKSEIIHLATHGVVDERNPSKSRIYLSENDDNDGILYASDLYNLNIQSNLVVLSACQTGLGKVSKGEGLIGLSRALIYAGTSNTIVSLWSVADLSTAQLMTDFYNGLIETKEQNYAVALRNAKLKMMASKEYADPFYWAPFVLIGE